MHGVHVLVVHNRYASAQPSGENKVVDQEVALLRGAGHRVEPTPPPGLPLPSRAGTAILPASRAGEVAEWLKAQVC